MSDWLQGNISRSDRALKYRQQAAQNLESGHKAKMEGWKMLGDSIQPFVDSAIKLNEERMIYGPEGMRTQAEKDLSTHTSGLRKDETTHLAEENAKSSLRKWQSLMNKDTPPHTVDKFGNPVGLKNSWVIMEHGYDPANRAKEKTYSNINDYLYDQAAILDNQGINFILRDEAGKAQGYDNTYEEKVKDRLTTAIMGDLKLRAEWGINNRDEAESKVNQWLKSAVWTDSRFNDEAWKGKYGDADLKTVIDEYRVPLSNKASGYAKDVAKQIEDELQTTTANINDPEILAKVYGDIEELNKNLPHAWDRPETADAMLSTFRNKLYAMTAPEWSDDAKAGQILKQKRAAAEEAERRKAKERRDFNMALLDKVKLTPAFNRNFSSGIRDPGETVDPDATYDEHKEYFYNLSPLESKQLLAEAFAQYQNQKTGSNYYSASSYTGTIESTLKRLKGNQKDEYAAVLNRLILDKWFASKQR